MNTFRLILWLALSTYGFADFEWPVQPVPIWIDGQLVRTTWRDGRPWVSLQEAQPVLHIRSGPEFFDLGEALQQRGYRVEIQADGSVDCRKPGGEERGQASPVAPNWPAPRTSGRNSGAARHQAEWQTQQRREASSPRLVASGYRYVADTEFIRAFCRVQNCGGGPSPACTAVGEFVDWYGHPFARDQRQVPPLEPGESVEMTFFSLVHKDDSNPNGVIKADKYTCRVLFQGAGLAEDGGPAKRNPTRAYRPSSAVKARVRSTDFRINSSTVRYTPGNSTPPSNTYIDANGFPRSRP